MSTGWIQKEHMPIRMNRKIRKVRCLSLRNAHCKEPCSREFMTCYIRRLSARLCQIATPHYRVSELIMIWLPPCLPFVYCIYRCFRYMKCIHWDYVFYSSVRIGCPDLNILWFFSVPPEKYRDSIYYSTIFTYLCRFIRALITTPRLTLYNLNTCCFFGHVTDV
jgi:hypothetical protein